MIAGGQCHLLGVTHGNERVVQYISAHSVSMTIFYSLTCLNVVDTSRTSGNNKRWNVTIPANEVRCQQGQEPGCISQTTIKDIAEREMSGTLLEPK